MGSDLDTKAGRAELGQEGLDDLGSALQKEISALADIDARYDTLTERLERWSAFPALKACWARQLEQRRRREREPHVLRLADLYQQMMPPLPGGRALASGPRAHLRDGAELRP